MKTFIYHKLKKSKFKYTHFGFLIKIIVVFVDYCRKKVLEIIQEPIIMPDLVKNPLK